MARREFAVSGAGAAEFERYLATSGPTPTHLFVDLAEEDFRLDTVPHVGAGDREAILDRKLAQIFRNTPYRHALLQGRETEGRRDDRVLYTAITNPEVLRPWLDMLERLEVPLAGIHSAAVFSARAAGGARPRLRAHAARHLHARARRCARRTSATARSSSAASRPSTSRKARALGDDDRRGDHAHLAVPGQPAPLRRRRPPRGVHPRCTRATARAIEPELRDFAQIQYRLLDIEQVALKLGLKPAPLDSTRRGGDGPPLPDAPGRRTTSPARSMRRYRHAAPRAQRAQRRPPAPSSRRASPGAAWTPRSPPSRLTEADERVAQQLSGLNREYDEIMRSLPSLRRRRLDDARRGDVLQRVDPQLSHAHELPRAGLRRAARSPDGAPHAARVDGDRCRAHPAS